MAEAMARTIAFFLRGLARWVLIAACVCGALASAGCQRNSPPPQQQAVTIGTGFEPLAGLLFVAEARGFFAAEGITPTLRKYASGKLALDAMLNGEVEAACAAETPVVFESLQRQDFSILVSIGTSSNDVRIVARRDRGISQPAELRGKRIATQRNSALHFFLHLFLLKHGLTEQEVTILFQAPASLPEALAKGNADAVAVREPLLSEAVLLLGSQAIVFEAAGLYVKSYPLIVPKSLLERKPGLARALLRALVRAEDFAATSPDQARTIVAQAAGIADTTVASEWRYLDLRVTLSQSLLLGLEDEARWAITQRQASQAALPNYLQFIDATAIAAVKPQAVTVVH